MISIPFGNCNVPRNGAPRNGLVYVQRVIAFSDEGKEQQVLACSTSRGNHAQYVTASAQPLVNTLALCTGTAPMIGRRRMET